ncbi:hypothetical protein C8Q70DRAFT_1050487 [Cubamyces menziesii]|nr:hypothetical protein C8Q70DRAFT_1050487 [Cubamyces menziesii]
MSDRVVTSAVVSAKSAEKNNDKLFPIFQKNLASDNLQDFTTAAEKLAGWLSKDKAYYPKARPIIIQLLEVWQLLPRYWLLTYVHTRPLMQMTTDSPRPPISSPAVVQSPVSISPIAPPNNALLTPLIPLTPSPAIPALLNEVRAPSVSTQPLPPQPSTPTPAAVDRHPPLTKPVPVVSQSPFAPPSQQATPSPVVSASPFAAPVLPRTNVARAATMNQVPSSSKTDFAANSEHSRPKAKKRKTIAFGTDFIEADLNWYKEKHTTDSPTATQSPFNTESNTVPPGDAEEAKKLKVSPPESESAANGDVAVAATNTPLAKEPTQPLPQNDFPTNAISVPVQLGEPARPSPSIRPSSTPVASPSTDAPPPPASPTILGPPLKRRHPDTDPEPSPPPASESPTMADPSAEITPQAISRSSSETNEKEHLPSPLNAHKVKKKRKGKGPPGLRILPMVVEGQSTESLPAQVDEPAQDVLPPAATQGDSLSTSAPAPSTNHAYKKKNRHGPPGIRASSLHFVDQALDDMVVDEGPNPDSHTAANEGSLSGPISTSASAPASAPTPPPPLPASTARSSEGEARSDANELSRILDENATTVDSPSAMDVDDSAQTASTSQRGQISEGDVEMRDAIQPVAVASSSTTKPKEPLFLPSEPPSRSSRSNGSGASAELKSTSSNSSLSTQAAMDLIEGPATSTTTGDVGEGSAVGPVSDSGVATDAVSASTIASPVSVKHPVAPSSTTPASDATIASTTTSVPSSSSTSRTVLAQAITLGPTTPRSPARPSLTITLPPITAAPPTTSFTSVSASTSTSAAAQAGEIDSTVSPFLSTGVRVLSIARGASAPTPSRHPVVFEFELTAAELAQIARWKERDVRATDDLSQTLCISFVSFYATQCVEASSSDDPAGISDMTKCGRPAPWPKDATSAFLVVNNGEGADRFVITPPFITTVDGCVDLSLRTLREGPNVIHLFQYRDHSDRVFAVLLHHPTRARLAELQRLRDAEVQWRQSIQRLGKIELRVPKLFPASWAHFVSRS